MRFLPHVIVLVVATSLPVAARASSDEPANPPTIPALSSDAAKPFVIDGVCRLTAADGFGFHVASDGKNQLCAVFDPHDGTPLYLSDGKQTLLYDLSGNRVVRVPTSRAYVIIGWDPKKPLPLGFDVGVDFNQNPKGLAKTTSSFRIDHFVAAAGESLKRLDGGTNTLLFAAQRPDGNVEAIQVPRGSLDWFRFTSCEQGKDFYDLELEARLPRSVPPEALHFPDLAALRRDIDIVDLDEQLMPNLVLFIKSGIAAAAKMGLAGGDEVRKEVNKVVLSPNWAELRERDRKLGSAYRAALAKQAVQYRAMKNAPAAKNKVSAGS
jgi:hypothetical protein